MTATAQRTSLLARLTAAGIDAATVVRNRRTGVYTVSFRDPDLNNQASAGTDRADVWAARITAALDDVQVVDTYTSVAEWRNPANPPVLFASVFLKVAA
jgi:hypothetical protein